MKHIILKRMQNDVEPLNAFFTSNGFLVPACCLLYIPKKNFSFLFNRIFYKFASSYLFGSFILIVQRRERKYMYNKRLEMFVLWCHVHNNDCCWLMVVGASELILYFDNYGLRPHNRLIASKHKYRILF